MEGRRIGSGKFVSEFYDELVQLWGRCACTKPLEFYQQSNCNRNGSNNAGLNDTYLDSADGSDVEDLPS